MYARFINSTAVQYMGRIGGEANGPIPHLDAVPAMDEHNRFVWVSTRDYPENYANLQYGTFDADKGTIPVAHHLQGDIYVERPIWIVMDQELNRDGSLLFYVNAQFPNPPGALPLFSNISLAVRDGSGFRKHPRAETIMAAVNAVVDPKALRYAPSSLGTKGLELYFTVRVPEQVVSGLFVAKRTSVDEPFGTPQRIPLPVGQYIEPEAPTLSRDGRLMMFSRIDCAYKVGCNYINVYKMDRLRAPDPEVLL
eukprot:TRINITY_DN10605_c4_g1_i1.p1 TRINITY_DN10605_c4_g1~~TRINITY_DN10605_c4_g1_i1.p1  ORF type:complete len:252 (+),score=73.97 TRINITY_DN10605_c4_g1_i1:73-828(+)